MKKIKKSVLFLVTFTLIFGLCGCGTKSPSNTVKGYFEQVKKGENGDFLKLVNKTLDKDEAKELETSDESTKKMMDSMKNLTYTINSEKIEGKNAKVNVKIKGPDIGGVMIEYIQKAMTMAFSEDVLDKKFTKKESDKLYEKVLLECLDNIKYTERTGDVSLTKIGGKWEINNNETLIKLLMNIDESFLNSQIK